MSVPVIPTGHALPAFVILGNSKRITTSNLGGGEEVKKLSTLLVFCASLFLVGALHAQQVDAQFGLSGIHAASATNFDTTDLSHSPQSLSGGVFPAFAADAIIWHNLGFNGEISWRASQALYQDSVPYRPIFYDFNGVYARKVNRVGFALMGGIGAESIRFYTGSANCGSLGCTNYVSSNHFLGHVGGALRLYVTRSVYVAPEVHYYFIHNNLEFTSDNATRFGVNVGYTFGR